VSDTTTPRTDSLMEEWHHCPPTKQLLNHSRQLERELAEAKAWSNAADDLDRQLTAHKAALEKCGEIIEGVINKQPASEGGSLLYERFDGEGNYSGAEHVDPCWLYFGVLEELHKALSEIAKLKGSQ